MQVVWDWFPVLAGKKEIVAGSTTRQDSHSNGSINQGSLYHSTIRKSIRSVKVSKCVKLVNMLDKLYYGKHQHLYSRAILVSHKEVLLSNCSDSDSFNWEIRGQRERSPLLTKIAHPSRPHLGRSQRSTQPECYGRASLWENRHVDHGNLLCQVSMLEHGLSYIVYYLTLPNMWVCSLTKVIMVL